MWIKKLSLLIAKIIRIDEISWSKYIITSKQTYRFVLNITIKPLLYISLLSTIVDWKYQILSNSDKTCSCILISSWYNTFETMGCRRRPALSLQNTRQLTDQSWGTVRGGFRAQQHLTPSVLYNQGPNLNSRRIIPVRISLTSYVKCLPSDKEVAVPA